MNEIQNQLSLLEKQVESGFSNAANALREIKESKIYKKQYGTWENYLKDRWGYSETKYYELLQGFRVNENLNSIGNSDTLPKNIGQARELSTLEPAQQVEVWEAVTEKYEPKEITATKIKEVRQEILEPEVEVIESNSNHVDYEKRFDLMEDTGDDVVEMMQTIYHESIKLKAGKKFSDWLESYLNYYIKQTKL